MIDIIQILKVLACSYVFETLFGDSGYDSVWWCTNSVVGQDQSKNQFRQFSLRRPKGINFENVEMELLLIIRNPNKTFVLRMRMQ